MTKMLETWPILFGLFVLLLGGVTAIALFRTVGRMVHLGPIGWLKDAFRVGDDFWLPLAVLIWVLVGAGMIVFLPKFA